MILNTILQLGPVEDLNTNTEALTDSKKIEGSEFTDILLNLNTYTDNKLTSQEGLEEMDEQEQEYEYEYVLTNDDVNKESHGITTQLSSLNPSVTALPTDFNPSVTALPTDFNPSVTALPTDFNPSNTSLKSNEIGIKKIDGVKYSLSNPEDVSYFMEMQNMNKGNDIQELDFVEFNTDLIATEISLSIGKTSDGNKEHLLINKTDEVINTNQDILLNNTDTSVEQESSIANQENTSLEKEVLKQIKEGLNSNSTSRSIQVMLKPASLGKVNMNLKFFNNTIHINVFVENSLTEEIIKQNISQVIEMIDPSSIIKIEKVNIKKVSDLYQDITEEDFELEKVNKNKLIRNLNYIKGIY